MVDDKQAKQELLLEHIERVSERVIGRDVDFIRDKLGSAIWQDNLTAAQHERVCEAIEHFGHNARKLNRGE
jgi:hypothetical protein